jgi:hypothetical protein
VETVAFHAEKPLKHLPSRKVNQPVSKKFIILYQGNRSYIPFQRAFSLFFHKQLDNIPIRAMITAND